MSFPPRRLDESNAYRSLLSGEAKARPTGVKQAEVEGNRTQFPNSFDVNDSEAMRAKTYAFEADSDLRRQLLDELQTAWQTFGRLDLVTESPAERQGLGKLRDRLSDLMNDLESIL